MNEQSKSVGMKRQILKWTVMTVMALFILPLHVSAGVPQQTIEAYVNKVLDVLREPASGESGKKAKEEKIWSIFDDIFDYTELSKRTLSRNWKKFNGDQQKEFEDLFRKLLGDVYMDRILAYKDEKVLFHKESLISDNKAEVQSKILTGTNEIPMDYRMIAKNDQWKVYDVIIEGVSMIKNYRSQFNSILSKKPPEALLKILRKKVGKS
ncbi:MAG: ABC transporter substrate-binding protein [Deltaproteobacteria bacterium]|jgi:phospholipid transport system substrate-binding protein